jgi:hypothetical protein
MGSMSDSSQPSLWEWCGQLPAKTYGGSTSMTESKQQDFDFEAIYARYPRKGEGKKAGMKRLKERIKTAADYANFERAVENYVRICIADKRDRKYVKLWVTFVNNYEDYVVVDPPDLPPAVDQLQRILKGEL